MGAILDTKLIKLRKAWISAGRDLHKEIRRMMPLAFTGEWELLSKFSYYGTPGADVRRSLDDLRKSDEFRELESYLFTTDCAKLKFASLPLGITAHFEENSVRLNTLYPKKNFLKLGIVLSKADQKLFHQRESYYKKSF